MKNKYLGATKVGAILLAGLLFFLLIVPKEDNIGLALLLPFVFWPITAFFMISFGLFLVSYFQNRTLSSETSAKKTNKKILGLLIAVVAIVLIYMLKNLTLIFWVFHGMDWNV